MVAVAAEVNSQIAAVALKLAATSVRAVLFAQKNHCSTIGQPFDSANSGNFIQNFITINFFFLLNNWNISYYIWRQLVSIVVCLWQWWWCLKIRSWLIVLGIHSGSMCKH